MKRVFSIKILSILSGFGLLLSSNISIAQQPPKHDHKGHDHKGHDHKGHNHGPRKAHPRRKIPPVTYFEYKPGRPFEKKLFSFKGIIGKKAIAMFYFISKDKLSTTELRAFAAASNLFKGRVAFYAVTKASDEKEEKEAFEKVKSMGITVPVLFDKIGFLAYQMRTRRVPAYAIIAKTGRAALLRGATLTEKVNAQETLLNVIARVARGEEPKIIAAPGYSPNPFNLIGKKAFDFKYKQAFSDKVVQLNETIKSTKKPILLAFWSITCPHCQRTMPVLQDYAKANQKRLKVITLAVLPDKKYIGKLKTYAKEKKLTLPVLIDPKGKSFTKYLIMTVPSFFVLDQTGKIQDAFSGGGKRMLQHIERALSKMNPTPAPPKATSPTKTPTTKKVPSTQKTPTTQKAPTPRPTK